VTADGTLNCDPAYFAQQRSCSFWRTATYRRDVAARLADFADDRGSSQQPRRSVTSGATTAAQSSSASSCPQNRSASNVAINTCSESLRVLEPRNASHGSTYAGCCHTVDSACDKAGCAPGLACGDLGRTSGSGRTPGGNTRVGTPDQSPHRRPRGDITGGGGRHRWQASLLRATWRMHGILQCGKAGRLV
jgi:hypothetical protein